MYRNIVVLLLPIVACVCVNGDAAKDFGENVVEKEDSGLGLKTIHNLRRNLLSTRTACTQRVEWNVCVTRCRHGRRCKSGTFCCPTSQGRRCCVDGAALPDVEAAKSSTVN